MKLDVTQNLYELDGDTPLKTSSQICVACRQPLGAGEPMTLRLVLTRALTARGQNEVLAFEEQMERYALAKRISADDEVELSIAEAGKLQGLVAAIYAPLVTGQVGDMLEGYPILLNSIIVNAHKDK